jgi:hypothetical protein
MSRVLNKKHWPHVVMINHNNDVSDALIWCAEMYPGKERWVYAIGGFIHFRDAADAAFCELKWS